MDTIAKHAYPQAFLKKGDCVALIAPSSGQKTCDIALVDDAINLLISWGLIVKYQPLKDASFMYLSAPDAIRLADIERAINDDEIKAIFCTRGGYGLSRIINKIKVSDDIASKCIVGYSDITALHLHFINHPKLHCIHGPVLASPQILSNNQKERDSKPEKLEHCIALNQARLKSFLFDNTTDGHNSPCHSFIETDMNLVSINEAAIKWDKKDLMKLLNHPSTSLTGGNLTMVACSLATAHEIKTDGKVLLLEEVFESPYRVDRLLTHLNNAGKLDNIRALIFGQMHQCESEQVSLLMVLEDLFKGASYPVFMGLPFGHASDNYPWLYS